MNGDLARLVREATDPTSRRGDLTGEELSEWAGSAVRLVEAVCAAVADRETPYPVGYLRTLLGASAQITEQLRDLMPLLDRDLTGWAFIPAGVPGSLLHTEADQQGPGNRAAVEHDVAGIRQQLDDTRADLDVVQDNLRRAYSTAGHLAHHVPLGYDGAGVIRSPDWEV
ncbi:MAG: hypothetical protein K0Q93_2163 [Nocardioidaceae bacterium]|nr:hypothetical protein [Nocardioidaceae bacterium]